jgi:DNA invertase Pin-like site-specific DNA recombinase
MPSAPSFAEALAACRVRRAKLSIAKLDRLARNVAFTSALMEAGCEFEAVDFPQANRLTIHILAAVAEHEAKVISERTKAALAAAKRRGVKLGGFRAGAKLTAKARQAGYKARAQRANAKAADYAGVIAELGTAGVTSLAGIAGALNDRGIPTASGRGTWQAVQVSRAGADRGVAGAGPAAHRSWCELSCSRAAAIALSLFSCLNVK